MTNPAAIIDTLDPGRLLKLGHFLRRLGPATTKEGARLKKEMLDYIDAELNRLEAESVDPTEIRDARIRRIRTAQQKQGYGPLGTVNIVLCQTGLQTGTLENCTNDQLAAVEAMVNDIAAGRRLIEEVERQVRGARHELSDR